MILIKLFLFHLKCWLKYKMLQKLFSQNFSNPAKMIWFHIKVVIMCLGKLILWFMQIVPLTLSNAICEFRHAELKFISSERSSGASSSEAFILGQFLCRSKSRRCFILPDTSQWVQVIVFLLCFLFLKVHLFLFFSVLYSLEIGNGVPKILHSLLYRLFNVSQLIMFALDQSGLRFSIKVERKRRTSLDQQKGTNFDPIVLDSGRLSTTWRNNNFLKPLQIEGVWRGKISELFEGSEPREWNIFFVHLFHFLKKFLIKRSLF